MSEQLTESFTIDDIEFIPQEGIVESRSDVKLKPFLYSAPMDRVTGYEMTKALVDAGHIAVVSRFLPDHELSRTVEEFGNHERVFFAVGLSGQDAIDYKILHKMEVNVAIDVAHGDSKFVHARTQKLREKSYIKSIMSGSIATAAAAWRAYDAGCTHLRVGIAGGSACTTSLMTGCGVRNAYAVQSIHQSFNEHQRARLEIIADGGIRYPGDAFKYMAIGADGVMLGSVFSKCREAPGWTRNGMDLTKTYRGQASKEFQSEYGKNAYTEGVSHKEITWDGTTVKDVVRQFEAGVRSGISYVGLDNLAELPWADRPYMRLTASGQREIQPHGLTTEYKY